MWYLSRRFLVYITNLESTAKKHLFSLFFLCPFKFFSMTVQFRAFYKLYVVLWNLELQFKDTALILSHSSSYNQLREQTVHWNVKKEKILDKRALKVNATCENMLPSFNLQTCLSHLSSNERWGTRCIDVRPLLGQKRDKWDQWSYKTTKEQAENTNLMFKYNKFAVYCVELFFFSHSSRKKSLYNY